MTDRAARPRSSPSARRPGTPRPYDFPAVERTRLANGLSLVDRPPAGPAARLGLAGPPQRRRSTSPTARPAPRSSRLGR